MCERWESIAAFVSGRKYWKYDFPSRKFCSVHFLTCIYHSETGRFQQHDDNSDFATLTFAMAAVADELIRFIIILQQKMVKTLQKFAGCLMFNRTADYLYISDI